MSFQGLGNPCPCGFSGLSRCFSSHKLECTGVRSPRLTLRALALQFCGGSGAVATVASGSVWMSHGLHANVYGFARLPRELLHTAVFSASLGSPLAASLPQLSWAFSRQELPSETQELPSGTPTLQHTAWPSRLSLGNLVITQDPLQSAHTEHQHLSDDSRVCFRHEICLGLLESYLEKVRNTVWEFRGRSLKAAL